MDGCHFVALAHSNCLGDLDCFFLDLQDAYVIGVYGLDCCDKFWRGTISFKDTQQEIVIGRVVGFDKINEAYIRCEVVILLRIEECLQGEKSISTTEFRCAAELESGTMFVE
jgi:hypothetical protein